MYNELQDKLIKKISERFQKRAEVVEALSEILHVGKDAVYRRLRGDKPLAIDEIAVLAKQFNISIDDLIFDESTDVRFFFNPFESEIKTFEDYLTPIVEDMGLLTGVPDIHVYYASSEIPIFYYCFFDKLFRFKLYVWGRTIWDFASLQDNLFSYDLIPAPIIRLSEQMVEHYCELKSTELWSLNIVDNTLNQIEYHVSSGGFQNPTDALELCEDLIQLTHHMQKMAAAGKKFLLNKSPNDNSGDFDLYHNEMVYTNNTILVQSDFGKAVYTSFGNPNFLKGHDEKVIKFMTDWLERVINKSNGISTRGEKSRNWFFNKLRMKIDQVKQRISYEIGATI